MNETTRAKALDALEGMRQIVRNKMLITGAYVDEKVSNPRLLGALCGGRKHCAIGSLWAGAGIKAKISDGSAFFLPGTPEWDRKEFLRRRPGLKVAYEQINLAADDFAEKNGYDLEISSYGAPLEALFETHYENDLTKQDLLKIISAAKRKVKALS